MIEQIKIINTIFSGFGEIFLKIDTEENKIYLRIYHYKDRTNLVFDYFFSPHVLNFPLDAFEIYCVNVRKDYF